MTRPLTLGYLSLPDLAPADLIIAAASGGFSSVGLRLTGRYIGDDHPRVIGDLPTIRTLKARLADTGLRLSNVSAFYMREDVTMAHLKPVIDVTAELGASIIVANRHDPDEARYLDNLVAYAEAAAGSEITLAIEFMPYSEIRSPAQALGIVRAAGQPNIGLLFDPLHLKRCGFEPADLRAIPPRYVSFAQICDASLIPPADIVVEARTGRMLPGEGGLPLHDYLDALPAGVEIECEIPCARLAGLPAAERARQIHDVTTRFLDAHAAPGRDR